MLNKIARLTKRGKWLIFFLVLVVLALNYGSIKGLVIKQYTFEDGFNELMELDAKHNTNWYIENINTSQWPLEEIDIVKEDYIALRDKFNKSSSPDREALLLLMEYKINNIEATKYFKLKNAMGSRGTVVDGFNCGDRTFILMAVRYFNYTQKHLQKARYAMDTLLTAYPQSRPVIDMENSRPIIMDPPFAEIHRFIYGEKDMINKYCPEKKEKEEEATMSVVV